jgi:8-oxo-dGTP diphosphatase
MAAIPEFGKVVPGKDYVLRPGGYGVVRDAAGLVAVVATSRGAFLLGGGQEGGETPRQALIREAREECGCTLGIGERMAVADEMLFAKAEMAYLRKRCTFFTATILTHDAALATEPDHVLVWLPLEDALGRLIHESHRWAVQRGVRQRKKI